MKQILNQIASVALAGTLTFGGGSTLSLSQNVGPCLNAVQVQNAIQNGNFMRLNEIKQMNGIDQNATVLNYQGVCRIDGQPHYIFNVLSSSGNPTHYQLRATDGLPYIAS